MQFSRRRRVVEAILRGNLGAHFGSKIQQNNCPHHFLFLETFPSVALKKQVVMHSADHYFADTCFPMHDYYSNTLNTSFLCGRFIVGHQPYVSRQLLCRELAQKDELCKLIYEVAKSVDEDFANEGLFVAICA